jgi:hypothetical protein
MRYRKKPIEVDAVKLPMPDVIHSERGRAATDSILRFVDAHAKAFRDFLVTPKGWQITTVDGNNVVVPWGAYVVIDSKGFPYPCDAEIFEANHEEVNDDGSPQ